MDTATASSTSLMSTLVSSILPVSISLAASMLLYVWKFGSKYGALTEKLDNLVAQGNKTESTLNNISQSVNQANNCIVELQSCLRTRLKGFTLTQSISTYGQANSPIILRDEFRPFVQESGLQAEIETNLPQLLNYIKTKHPKTGLDAQNIISELVISDQIDKYINTSSFKDHLYQKGKTQADYYGILVMYLFEKLIPLALEA